MTHFELGGQKNSPPLAGKKFGHLGQQLLVDRALGLLSLALHADQPGLAQLLQVVGDRGGADGEVLADVAHAAVGLLAYLTDAPRGAAGAQAQEDAQPAGVGQRLEDGGVAVHIAVN